jgi:hypothetical protein
MDRIAPIFWMSMGPRFTVVARVDEIHSYLAFSAGNIIYLKSICQMRFGTRVLCEQCYREVRKTKKKKRRERTREEHTWLISELNG